MSVAYAHEPATNWDYLLETWHELDVPEGLFRPELTVEGMIVTPAPGGAHNLIAARVHRCLLAAVPAGCEVFQTQAVGLVEAEAIFVPDLCVAQVHAIPPDSTPVNSAHVLLAVEITSRSNAQRDRTFKKEAYALGGIPRYLLIDPHDASGPTAFLMSDPLSTGQYGTMVSAPFGTPLKLGDPFGVELDTAEFGVR